MKYKKVLITFFLLWNFDLQAKDHAKKTTFDQKINYSSIYFSEKFQPTTKIKGSLFFTLGALDSKTSTESIHSTFENKIRLNTSFKGSDNLLLVVESGNAFDSPLNLDLQSKKGENIKVSTLLYEFPIGNEFDAIIGPKMFGYHGLAGKSTVYNERIAILDGSNYTTSSGIGPGIGISTKKNNGFNSTIKLASNSSKINDESIHLISQIGFNKNKYGGTITSNLNDEFDAYGIAIYYKPDRLPSLSASIEQKEKNTNEKINNWIVGLQKSFNYTKYGIAVGTHDSNENIGYEFWSEISINDNFKIIPVVFIRENNISSSEKAFAINTKFTY